MKLPVDTKSFSLIIVVLIIMVSLSSVIIYHEANENKTETTNGYQMVARANTEGSGIYINVDVLSERGGPSAFYTDNGDGTYTIDATNKDAWGGLILGTPGAATIQHVQLQQIASSMGLKWSLYTEGSTPSADTVYYVGGMNNATNVLGNGIINGGCLWEPQFSLIIANEKYTQLALTNNVFPGHTCCVVAGMKDYMSSHVDVTERFLAAYVLGMRYVQDALDGDTEKYEKLVEICMNHVSGISKATVEDALANITYVDADNPTGSLDDLKKDVGNLYDSLAAAGLLQHTIKDMGFNYTSQFTNSFIDDAYLSNAIKRLDSDDTTLKTGNNATLTVVCIGGDIHQIAIHVANDLLFFKDYNLSVNVTTADSGPNVAVALQNGTGQFGLMGAPPATSTTVNSLLLHA